MNKRGQIYLIAALVIVGLIIGFIMVSNFALRGKDVNIRDLGEELGIESEHVLDYGILKFGNSEGDLQDLVLEFSHEYAQYAGEGKNLYFIYGDEEEVKIIKYEDVLNEIGVVAGDTESKVIIKRSVRKIETEKNERIAKIKVRGGQEYDFDLKEGDNFYFIISQEVGGEHHVITSYE